MKKGIRKKRNDILDSLSPSLLRYKGAGSGILRALRAYPNIDLSTIPKPSKSGWLSIVQQIWKGEPTPKSRELLRRAAAR